MAASGTFGAMGSFSLATPPSGIQRPNMPSFTHHRRVASAPLPLAGIRRFGPSETGCLPDSEYKPIQATYKTGEKVLKAEIVRLALDLYEDQGAACYRRVSDGGVACDVDIYEAVFPTVAASLTPTMVDRLEEIVNCRDRCTAHHRVKGDSCLQHEYWSWMLRLKLLQVRPQYNALFEYTEADLAKMRRPESQSSPPTTPRTSSPPRTGHASTGGDFFYPPPRDCNWRRAERNDPTQLRVWKRRSTPLLEKSTWR